MRARALLPGSGVEWAEANTDTRGREKVRLGPEHLLRWTHVKDGADRPRQVTRGLGKIGELTQGQISLGRGCSFPS